VNRYSLSLAQSGPKTALCPYKNARIASIPGLIRVIRGALPDTAIEWGSVIFFPPKWYPAASFLEERTPVIKNPFGSFIGLAFPVVFTHITVQDPLGDAAKAKAAGTFPAPGPARRREIP